MRAQRNDTTTPPYFSNLGAKLVHKFGWARRRIASIDTKLIDDYCNDQKTRKLHIGAGDNFINGWLNCDYAPRSQRILVLDATKRFPFSDNVFDYAFSEHMIEHISYADGVMMLTECHRVLRNGGKVRISTPNLRFLIELYADEKSDRQREYIKWAANKFIKEAPCASDTFIINNFVRDWGHLFIYDEKTLRLSLDQAGFKNVVRRELNESEDESLRNLENEKRMPQGFLALESITLEGTKIVDDQFGVDRLPTRVA